MIQRIKSWDSLCNLSLGLLREHCLKLLLKLRNHLLELRLLDIHSSLRIVLSYIFAHWKLRRLHYLRFLRIFLLISRFFLADYGIYCEAILLNLACILEVIIKFINLLNYWLPFINSYHYTLSWSPSKISHLEVQEYSWIIFEDQYLLCHQVLCIILAYIVILVQQVVHQAKLVLENLSLL